MGWEKVDRLIIAGATIVAGVSLVIAAGYGTAGYLELLDQESSYNRAKIALGVALAGGSGGIALLFFNWFWPRP